MSTNEQRGNAPAEPADQPDRDIKKEQCNAPQSGAIFAGQQWRETPATIEEGNRR